MGGKYNAALPEFAFQSTYKNISLCLLFVINVFLQMYSDKESAQGVHF